ncbi:hypothetical protein COV06_01995 [Candidatus Uhrbacteria bacterium CG10_big_fil_rev_8_21_14_0_10_50_16]|uniref:UDP-N-acetylmuramoyl-tripeptide--D-alanyl-D-alanine ligase n=1 Tax=Candidatus Uhrbacteria bacterium CG10_big_fil_rev_8_21_14_0_10_50_16 TaxID=1975039 RepID=A0A2H0RP21_9BACT|nr:MAG: hypothetical protein COV06_01995 [Candidatus Uhrbacteria bacterium CG10_big_fil_rev_8_21_14_0_10_50_16]
MTTSFLSRYRPRFLRSLVYMLQATEYNIGDYINWLHRTRDFSKVEKRKQLKQSHKALALLYLGRLLWLALILLGTSLSVYGSAIATKLLGILVLMLSPFLLAYIITIPLFILKLFVQKPIEALIIWRATQTMARHKGVKIAIAGSYGKTSMREMLHTVLSEGKHVAAPPHSYNTPLGVSAFVKTLKGDEKVLIFELGEYYPGDVAKLCKIVQPDIGVITGINEAHLQKFKTLKQTAKTIFELAEALPSQPVYINGESQIACTYAKESHILYDQNGIGSWHVHNPATDLSGTSFTLTKDDQQIKLKSKLLGMHQIGPLVAAVDIAHKLGLTNEHIQSGVANTKPFEHRLEPRVDESGITTLDDSYNGNPDGVRVVIDFLKTLKGRRFYVTPGLVEMGSRSKEVHMKIGHQLASAKIERVVLISNSVTPYIEQGLREANYKGEIIWFDDALKAYATLPSMTVKGDIILLQNDWPDQYA